MRLNEISTAKLDQYTKAADADYTTASAEGDYKKSFKRASGMMKASGKKIDNDVKSMQKARGVAEDKAGWSIKGSAKPAPKGPAPSWRLNPDGTSTDKNTGITYNRDGSVVKTKEGVAEKAPPGREKQVKALKKKFDDPGAPYAIAWAQHNKKKSS